jgi:hypothetical protein
MFEVYMTTGTALLWRRQHFLLRTTKEYCIPPRIATQATITQLDAGAAKEERPLLTPSING